MTAPFDVAFSNVSLLECVTRAYFTHERNIIPADLTAGRH